MNQLPKNTFFAVGITNSTEKEILEYIVKTIEKTTENFFIVTPSPEFITYAKKHPHFGHILNQARIALCDGIGIILAGAFLGRFFKQRVTGTDFMTSLCREVHKKPITVGFLGAQGGIAELTAECLIGRFPGLRVVFTGSEWNEKGFFDYNHKVENPSSNIENAKTLSSTLNLQKSTFYRLPSTTKSIDILFVAFGFPKQEEWMFRNLNTGIYRVAIGVGGAFDYISGQVPRAPSLLRSMGLEWLFRLAVQPWRIKRQLALVEFVWMVLKEKFKK